jgi:hypothetical protein
VNKLNENPAVLIPLTNVEDDTGIPKTPILECNENLFGNNNHWFLNEL